MESKPFYVSKRFWGIVLAVLGHFGFFNWLSAKVGIPIPVDNEAMATYIVGGIGDILALWGSVVAKGPLTIAPAAAPLEFIADPRAKERGQAIVLLLCVLAIVAGLAACAVTPKSPKQALYLAEGEINAALEAANAYKALPDCASKAVLCSDAAVVKRVQAAGNCAVAMFFTARNVAVPASEAQPVTVSPQACPDPTIQAAITGASAANLTGLIDVMKSSVASLVGLTNTLKTQ